MTKVLELKNISKKYKDYSALNKVSFSLDEGEIIGLVGPNGSGKTTLMRIIVGLTKNFEGEVLLEDGTAIGCVIETPSFYPFMTGYENLKYFASINDVSIEKVMETTELLGLKDALNKKVKDYSLGMKQRLGILAALLRDPKLLILDEPTNGLDPTGIHELREYIKGIARKKKITVLISSHILSELEKICDKAVIIKHGEIVDVLKIDDFKNSSEVILTIGIENVIDASKIFKDNNIAIFKSDKDSISISVNKEESNGIVNFLNNNNIKFNSLYEQKRTLEDKFLDLMEENNIK
ncbi:ABC transporter ATP-binding protein [Clostridium vincentii]|uniref:Putative ABC transporter ATP-binding protein YxlF n=1 Tax=Clostridium vincentii TaxID=52704 RepID=A0A2T0BHE0_9CLOT|nr:ABC transporter ATP-binding protein [Clostridium vincentii]PRR83232.1 putative ABC transporter ATP-binding protein YxlF [Clostridium vincentii]